jgi:predicted Holliday junction resolvase-like endonuclease
MPKDPTADLNIEAIQDLLENEEASMQHLFKRALNFYVSNDASRKTEDQKLDDLKKAIEESLK